MCVRNRTSTVLLVEDEVLIRMFIAELLAEAGFEVIEARCRDCPQAPGAWR
jgi:DNA-binding response OmpR family regulator